MGSVGIDLGTTNSCVAYMEDGKVSIIPNDQGHRTTPSCVAYTDKERMVGEKAKHHMSRNPENTVYDVKRIIGRRFADPSVQADKENWPFEIVEDRKKIKIKVQYLGLPIDFNPEEVSAAVLEQLKADAEVYIGKKVTGAVITVPAYFSDAQRRATKLAARIAGLHVLGMINEPTAAAVAYGLERKTKEKSNVLIYDLGGGTFDVTVLIIENNMHRVKAVGGDTHLGGQDFNARLYAHLLQEFRTKQNVNSTPSKRAKNRLLQACERAKNQLSSAHSTSVDVVSFMDGIDLETTISRAKFEHLCEELFHDTIGTVERVLDDADILKEQIDDVVLVGGSTRIPFLQKLLKDYFGEEKICKNINPDEAVAYGAAVHAAFLSGDIGEALRDLKLNDVIPLSLGIRTRGGVMTFVVPRNTTIPVKNTRTIVTSEKDQQIIEYPIYEGELSMVEKNNLLGCVTLSGLPKLPAGKAKTEVCFEVDENGVLHVSARDLSGTGHTGRIQIAWDKGRFNQEELNEMIEKAEKSRKADEVTRKNILARHDLESLVNKAQKIVQAKEQGTESQRKDLDAESTRIMNWMKNNTDASIAELKVKHGELEEAIRLSERIGGYGAEDCEAED